MAGQLSYITLGVADLARALPFYRDGLQLPLLRQSEQLAFFDLGGLRLALYPALQDETGLPPAASRGGHASLSLNLPSRAAVDRLLARTLASGGTLLRTPQAAPWGGYRGYVSDPDGFVWELVWHPDYALQTPCNEEPS